MFNIKIEQTVLNYFKTTSMVKLQHKDLRVKAKVRVF